MGLPLRHSLRTARNSRRGFTLIELLIVMVIILILAGIVLALAGPAQNRAARSRATAEIQALRSALERYKADNVTYPRDANKTDSLDPNDSAQFDVTDQYKTSSAFLYQQLAGDDPSQSKPTYPPNPGASSAKRYYDFKPSSLGGYSSATTSFSVSSVNDPWGNSYGYSTANEADTTATPPVNPARGNSPGYDLWSTAGQTGSKKITSQAQQERWIKTW
ncbi:MAG: type II secretion system protein [Verrucomicrobia bacterium]|nr:type II secretion system protein [Verrucomicrobiota bacterium]